MTGGSAERFGICEFCGKTYWKRYNAQRYCCKSCATSAQAKRKRELGNIAKPKPGMRRKCKLCGELFMPADPRQLYCSDGYRKVMTRIYKQNSNPPEPKPQKKQPAVRISYGYTMKDIMEYMAEHDCQYAEAVRKLEGGGADQE